MQTHRSIRQIRLAYHRSFRRPVKIRVEVEPPRSTDRVTSLFPAGALLLLTPRPPRTARPALRVIRHNVAPEPDWRIVGDQDAEPIIAAERACV
jgi:hypothetical protein